MHISAKADYAVRAAIQLASSSEFPVTSESIATAQQIPAKFLEAILAELRHSGLVKSRRGAHGGYWLSRPASEILILRGFACSATGIRRVSTPASQLASMCSVSKLSPSTS